MTSRPCRACGREVTSPVLQATLCEACVLGGAPRAHAAAAREAERPTVGRRHVPLAQIGCYQRVEVVPRRKGKTPERQVTDDVLAALKQAGLLLADDQPGPGVRLRRNSQGVAMLPSGGRITYGLGVGTADFVGYLVPGARWVSLEIKSEAGSATPAQRAHLAQVRADGGVAAVVRSGAEAVAVVREALRGKA